MKAVIDASVALKWFVPEGDDEPTERLRGGSHRLIAPEFMKLEVANTLWKKRRRGEVDDETCNAILAALSAGLIRYEPDGDLVVAAFRLARAIDHTVHDCLYLALAEAERGRVVTADRRLVEKARAGGVDRLVMPLAEV